MNPQLRPGSPPPGTSFQALHLKTPAFRAMWHLHDEFELNFVARGHGTRWIGGAQGRFAPGDVILVPPGLPHSWESDAAPDGMAEAVVVLFAADVLGRDDYPPEWRGLRNMLADSRGGVHFDDPDGAIGRDLLRLADATGATRLVQLLGVFDRLGRADRRGLSGERLSDAASERDLRFVRRALDLMRVDRGAAPKQSALAARLGLSPSSFSRLFRRVTGRSYSQHVDALRLDEACAMLRRSDLRIAEICFAAGFANLSNFNRRFRSALGQTPGAYRRAFGELARASSHETPTGTPRSAQPS